jgi:hypothetical protein
MQELLETEKYTLLCGIVEDMKKINGNKEGQIMNIKENVYIYSYKCSNTLIDEQNAYENNLFYIVMAYADTLS